MKLRLLAHTWNPELIVASSAKLCYSKTGVDGLMEQTPEQVEKFLDKLMEIGHESPVEHAVFTFAVEGISRVCSHQLVRHRISSYSQQSQRYVKLDQFEYITPPAIENNEEAKARFIQAMEEDQEHYDELVDMLLFDMVINFERELHLSQRFTNSLQNTEWRNDFKTRYPKEYQKFEKKAIEDARFVFPNACETKLVFTMNARTLMNFFKHRCCNRAQWEIRDMANEMLKEVKKVAPTLFKYAGAPCTFGSCPEGSLTCGNPIRLEKGE